MIKCFMLKISNFLMGPMPYSISLSPIAYCLLLTAYPSSINSLGSVTTPVIAAAAATNGLASIVLAPGPCLPSKFLLLVLTAYLPAGILSSFMAKHAEQPG